MAAPDHHEAMELVLAWLSSLGAEAEADAVGHRVVHGGERFIEPELIDEDLIATIDEVSHLAPLHNAPALSAIRAARGRLGRVPMVATFDTAFHRTMPERASRYALPWEVAEQHSIYRYGFHGLAHRYMAERYSAITSRSPEQTRLITLQLGNGCSATAIAGGRSVDTSMGFTPLEGLVMGTRSGDVDPAAVAHLAANQGLDASEVEDLLNNKSGLLGVSGRSHDMRDLLEAEERGDVRASLAVELFCYRARKYIGAYMAALGGTEAVLFGGGIGENAPGVRERICRGLEFAGLILEGRRNANTVGREGAIHDDASEICVHVILVNEEAVIANDTVSCLSERSRSGKS